MQRQQRGVELDHAVLGDRAEFGRREQQDIGHDPNIGIARLQRGLRFRIGIFRKTIDRELLLLGRDDQRIRARAGPLRRRKHAGHRVAPCDECIEHGLAESLLTDDDDAHVVLSRLR